MTETTHIFKEINIKYCTMLHHTEVISSTDSVKTFIVIRSATNKEY